MEKQKKRSWKKWLIIISAIIIVGLVVMAFASNARKNAMNNSTFDQTALKKESINQTLTTSGTISSKHSEVVTNPYSLPSIESSVGVGDKVKEGDVLATYDLKDINQQILAKQLQIDTLEKQLKTLDREGNISVKSAWQNAWSYYSLAKSQYEDTKARFDSGQATQIELDNAKSSKDRAYNDYVSAKARYESYNIDEEKRLLEENIKIEKLSLESLKADSGDGKITSPIEGTVTDIYFKKGDDIQMMSPLFEIMDLDMLEIQVNLSEYEISSVKEGQKAIITLLGNKSLTYEGTVEKIYPVAKSDGQQSSVKVIIGIDKPDSGIKPGFSASVDILVAQASDAFTVPYEALEKTDVGYQVTRKNGDSQEKIDVEIGVQGDLKVQIISDKLKDGDIIIYESITSILDDTSTIRPRNGN